METKILVLVFILSAASIALYRQLNPPPGACFDRFYPQAQEVRCPPGSEPNHVDTGVICRCYRTSH